MRANKENNTSAGGDALLKMVCNDCTPRQACRSLLIVILYINFILHSAYRILHSFLCSTFYVLHSYPRIYSPHYGQTKHLHPRTELSSVVPGRHRPGTGSLRRISRHGRHYLWPAGNRTVAEDPRLFGSSPQTHGSGEHHAATAHS